MYVDEKEKRKKAGLRGRSSQGEQGTKRPI
jgi:hypothetical protein